MKRRDFLKSSSIGTVGAGILGSHSILKAEIENSLTVEIVRKAKRLIALPPPPPPVEDDIPF